MAFRLEEVVPWGRSFEEYQAMFALSDKDLSGRILGCADGPASFNAGLTKRGGKIVSADPLYRFSREEIRNRIDQVFENVLGETRKNAHEFVWETIPSVEVLGRTSCETGGPSRPPSGGLGRRHENKRRLCPPQRDRRGPDQGRHH